MLMHEKTCVIPIIYSPSPIFAMPILVIFEHAEIGGTFTRQSFVNYA